VPSDRSALSASLSVCLSARLPVCLCAASPDVTPYVVSSLLLSGFFIGPIQPIAIESAAECTYPVPESYATAVQQVTGNLFSAAMFPLIMWTRNKDLAIPEEKGLWILCGGLAVAFVVYATFNGQYKRLERERLHEQKLKQRMIARSGHEPSGAALTRAISRRRSRSQVALFANYGAADDE
jgi:hypothetical protein